MYILVIFNIFDFIENKRTSSKLLIYICVVTLNKCKIKHIDIASHYIDPRLEATYGDFNLCIYHLKM